MDPDSPEPTARRQDLSTVLAQRVARDDADQALTLVIANRTVHPAVHLDRPEEVAAAAVGLLVLERLAAHGGTRIGLRTIRELRERLTRPLASVEVMELEVEAYDAMSWLAGLDRAPERGAEHPAARERDLIAYDPGGPPLDLLRRAIAEEFDVVMQYYTQSRGELTRRQVTPLHVEAETYLHAYCHSRREERVFRISRIAEIRPVDGTPVGGSGEPGPGGPAQGRLPF